MLFCFFWRDWMRIFKGLGRSLRDREISEDDPDARLGWLLIVGTIPAGILGLLLQDSLRKIFASPTSAAIFLMLNGVLLYGAERLRRRAPVTEQDDDARIARTVSWRGGFFVGAAQALALIPGFSRSGATMAGGLLVGLSNEDAARFAFLLATPIIGAAAVLKLPELLGSTGNGVRGQALVAALCSAAAAWFAVKFLMRYLRTNTLMPFAIYCFVVRPRLHDLLRRLTKSLVKPWWRDGDHARNPFAEGEEWAHAGKSEPVALRAARAHDLERRRLHSARALRSLRPTRLRRSRRHGSRNARAAGGARRELRRVPRRPTSRGAASRELYDLLVIPGLELTYDDPDPLQAAHAVAVGLRSYVDLSARSRGSARLGARTRGGACRRPPVFTRAPRNRVACDGGVLGASRARELVDRYELFNRHTLFEWVAAAGLPAIASGDFHGLEHLAGWKTLLPCLKSEPAVISYLRSARPAYLVHLDDGAERPAA